ncbi:MAG TPA: tripartite tricarboxylate transporter substrate binding protein [Xanthobacteraceae bacterium]|jgi:tripartite-type tricarboxylate transporter receptor subunit TctC
MNTKHFTFAPRRLVSLVFAVAACLFFSNSDGSAEDFPNHPVHMIVAFAPGGATDFTARIIAEKMGALLGQPVVVENKPGANGAIGAEYVAKADADGYTLFFTTVGAVAINPAFRKDLPYDPLKDFTAIGKAAVNSTMLVVNAQLPAHSARELAALAKQRSKPITIGITGRGAISDLGRLLFESAAGIKLEAVPYRGAAPALTDVIGGHLDGLFSDVPTVMAQIHAGKIRAIAATSTKRSDIFPNVPTFVEQGFAGVVADNWAGILAPAGTPAPAIAKLNAALVGALDDPAVRQRLHNAGTAPAPSSPDEFAAYLREELARWSKLIEEKGIKPE